MLPQNFLFSSVRIVHQVIYAFLQQLYLVPWMVKDTQDVFRYKPSAQKDAMQIWNLGTATYEEYMRKAKARPSRITWFERIGDDHRQDLEGDVIRRQSMLDYFTASGETSRKNTFHYAVTHGRVLLHHVFWKERLIEANYGLIIETVDYNYNAMMDAMGDMPVSRKQTRARELMGAARAGQSLQDWQETYFLSDGAYTIRPSPTDDTIQFSMEALKQIPPFYNLDGRFGKQIQAILLHLMARYYFVFRFIPNLDYTPADPQSIVGYWRPYLGEEFTMMTTMQYKLFYQVDKSTNLIHANPRSDTDDQRPYHVYANLSGDRARGHYKSLSVTLIDTRRGYKMHHPDVVISVHGRLQQIAIIVTFGGKERRLDYEITAGVVSYATTRGNMQISYIRDVFLKPLQSDPNMDPVPGALEFPDDEFPLLTYFISEKQTPVPGEPRKYTISTDIIALTLQFHPSVEQLMMERLGVL
jgi:hypothetical protein